LLQINGLISGKQKEKPLLKKEDEDNSQTYQTIKSRILDDILSDEEGEKGMEGEIKRGIDVLLDSDDDMRMEDLVEKDEEFMIEKDIDNWF